MEWSVTPDERYRAMDVHLFYPHVTVPAVYVRMVAVSGHPRPSISLELVMN